MSAITAYHPQCNGMVECCHHQLKDAMRFCCFTSNWMDALLVIFIAILTAPKLDLSASPADLVYGSALALPAEMVVQWYSATMTPADFLGCLQQTMQDLQTSLPLCHGQRHVYIPPGLSTVTHVILREDMLRPGLTMLYPGPFPVVRCTKRTMVISMNRHNEMVSVDHVKPAFVDVGNAAAPPPALVHHDYL